MIQNFKVPFSVLYTFRLQATSDFSKNVAFRLHLWYNDRGSSEEDCVMNELGTYIKEKRTEKGLSIRRLAELADISHTEVKRIEDGLRKQTSPQVLRSIASALGVPYEDLMTAAGYIDEPATETESGTVAAGIKDTEDLSQEEIDQVNQYIAFLKSQRKD
ncbi:helix-turn-helix transcriptional regulator [Mogibacterium neglectum]|uniref:helix-turn-helix domain-containing protein n=1 Tax=Mogibacterium neglectum TaxID=114528 RepID=UPI00272D60A6|nr:helix-turn-helix transcriptional regulator [Mogibacterium neglectum]WLD76512.1 helix-turn-helix transcriptional regulator [Mogibacterium neglectum]